MSAAAEYAQACAEYDPNDRAARWRPDGTGEMWEGARDTPYADDPVAQVMLGEHGTFNQVEVAAFYGCTHQRIAQVEAEALANAELAARRMGLEWRDIHAYLTQQRGKGRAEPAW